VEPVTRPAPPGASPLGGAVPAPSPVADLGSASLGELFGRLTEDFSTLMRKEVELAKAEIKQEASKAGKGAGLLGGTGAAALLAVLMLSFAAAWGLAAAIPTGWAFLIVAIIWAAVAAAMFVTGRKELQRVKPVPEKTVESIKEDIQWVKHPTS
jgi:hypothetical protein